MVASRGKLPPLPPRLAPTYRHLCDRLRKEIKNAQGTIDEELGLGARSRLYWRIGQHITHARDWPEWRDDFIDHLGADLAGEVVSRTSLDRRRFDAAGRFYRAYQEIGTEAIALAWLLPWEHNLVVIQGVSEGPARTWYLRHALRERWPLKTLKTMIRRKAHRAVHPLGHPALLSPADHDSEAACAGETFRQSYVLHVPGLPERFTESQLEDGLIARIDAMLDALGPNFAFLGRQVALAPTAKAGANSPRADLLFYHTILRRHIVVELKRGRFAAEHAGKINFYCNLVDERLRTSTDGPTLGLILCESVDGAILARSLPGMTRGIAVGVYTIKDE